tara:strand:+ start:4846 stop:5658 length:813 start_codon:yes stop_codon:yes gene_type:complete
MIPAKFEYKPAQSKEEALSLLAEYGDEAKLLAGGHSLLPLMKLRLATPEVLIDIGAIDDLSYIQDKGDVIAIGALTKHRHVEQSDLLKEHIPLLAHTASHVGDPQVRNRGTIGGSLCHGDPASDLPAAILATRATLVISGTSGDRTVEADAFFTDFWETEVKEDELLTEILIPKFTGESWSYQKFNRRAQDWAIVGCAVQAGSNPGIGMVNMGSTPVRAVEAENALKSGGSAEEVAELADSGLTPPTDIHGNEPYRRSLAKVLLQRALEN